MNDADRRELTTAFAWFLCDPQDLERYNACVSAVVTAVCRHELTAEQGGEWIKVIDRTHGKPEEPK